MLLENGDQRQDDRAGRTGMDISVERVREKRRDGERDRRKADKQNEILK